MQFPCLSIQPFYGQDEISHDDIIAKFCWLWDVEYLVVRSLVRRYSCVCRCRFFVSFSFDQCSSKQQYALSGLYEIQRVSVILEVRCILCFRERGKPFPVPRDYGISIVSLRQFVYQLYTFIDNFDGTSTNYRWGHGQMSKTVVEIFSVGKFIVALMTLFTRKKRYPWALVILFQNPM